MSVPSLRTVGSFQSPFDEEDPNHTVVYELDMYKQEQSTEYYAGFVGSGTLGGSTKFLTSIPIAFTWNPNTKAAVVKLGNFGWTRNPSEYNAVPKNLTDCRFQTTDSEESIICFTQKRFDYMVSVSRTMNAILNDASCTIKVEKFTDEERKEYDEYDAERPLKNYLRHFEAIEWPETIRGVVERTEWLKAQDASTYRNLKRMRWDLERDSMNKNGNPDVAGSYYGCMDGVVHGPFPNESELDRALEAIIPIYYPACPYKIRFENGYWYEIAHDAESDEEVPKDDASFDLPEVRQNVRQ